MAYRASKPVAIVRRLGRLLVGRGGLRSKVLGLGVRRRHWASLAAKGWETLRGEGPRGLVRKLRRKLAAARAARQLRRPIPYSVMVSVIVPVYDRTEMLRESIESILAQDYQDFELLLACDGSPPETLAVVRQYSDHPKVRAFSWAEQSGGPAKGRNLLIAEARGRYVAFQDSDDRAEPHRLRRCVEALERSGADVVYGGFRVATDWDADWRSHQLRDGQVILPPPCDAALLRRVCVPCQSTVMARASVLRMAGGLKTELKLREDHELWLRLAERGARFQALPEVLTTLRLHPQNLELSHYRDAGRWHRRMLEVCGERGPLRPRVAFLLPSLGIGGGVSVVLQYAHRLSKLGHEVTVLSANDERRCDWFPYQSFRVVPLSQARGEMFDVLVATFWTTAELVARVPAARKLYLIQSDESRFYADDPVRRQAALATYELDLEPIAIARWLQRWLAERFGRTAHYLPNGIDPAMFHPAEPLAAKGRRPRVLLEGPIDVPFKGMKNAFAAVADLDCEVWCVSGAGRPQPGWRCDRFFERVPQHQMKHVYSSCDVLLKMSEIECFFLPPLEMMACGQGACVLGEVTGMDEYVVPEQNALVVPKGDVAAAREAVRRLLDDSALRARLITEGLATARRFDWDELARQLQSIVCGQPAADARHGLPEAA